VAYEAEVKQGTTSSAAQLRRNTHRLEKGLLMRPRRDVFALRYIEETVEAFAKRAQANAETPADAAELDWSQDVLTAYFEATDASNDTIAKAHRAFEAVAQSRPTATCDERGDGRRIPYRRAVDARLPIDYRALLNLAYHRRSVRWFLPKPVPRERIDDAVRVAAQAPSACNRQPFEFRIFDDPDLVRQIAKLPGGTGGYDHNIPVMVAVVGHLRAYFSERDRHVIYIDASLASMMFMLALETMGLSSCAINWPDVEHREQAMSRFLKLEPDERPIMLLAVGYPDPDGMVAYSQKKPLAHLRSYNHER
jgi:nitroreductase